MSNSHTTEQTRIWTKGGNTTTVEDMHKGRPYELLGGLVYSGTSPKGYTNHGTATV